MTTPKINISTLDFESIKNSLKTYLSGKSEFQGYDFDGSGLNLLLDIFAYNTLYYGFYSNMIANEAFLDTAQIENNIVSLVKPLGYLVGGKTCSKIDLEITPKTASSITLTAYTTNFSGTSTSGTVYRFYPIEDVTVVSGSDTPVTLYEARLVINDLPVAVNATEQKAFIGNTGVDLNTVRVKVNGEVWTKYNNYQPSPGPDGNVYFIDRTPKGFYLIFGKRTLNDYQTSFGKTISDTDVVTVSYLVPTGSKANGISSVLNSDITVTTPSITGNGTDSVDLDLVKFFAPKLFATNDRAVTKDDYYGLLLASNLLPAGIDSIEKLNIWGGEDGDPASHGRVFVSFADLTLTPQSESVKKTISYLKSKSIVTVVPEFIQPQLVTVDLNLVANNVTTSQLSGIATVVNNFYNSELSFNNSINLPNLKTLIATNYPSVRGVDISSAFMNIIVKGSGTEKTIYFKNNIQKNLVRNIDSSQFTYNSQSIRLGDNKLSDSDGEIIAYTTQGVPLPSLGRLGTVNYTNGIVNINSGVIPLNTQITVTARLEDTTAITIKDEFLINVNTTVTVV
jgi:hypothetical protein